MKETSLKDKTAKGLLWGGLSNGLQQLLNLFFGIFLARMLNAADYGMVGMLSIFSLIASALQESGFQAALANKKDITARDYNAVFWFSTGVSACLYLLLFAAAPLIADFYHTPALTALARYSFLSFFVASLNIVPSAYLFRNLMVKQRTVAVTVGMVVSGTVGVTMAYFGFAYWGIATQTITYIAVTGLGYWLCIPWRPSLRIDLSPLRTMIGFSSKLLVTNIFNAVNNNLLTVILGRCYTEQEVGYFTQANKWNQMGHLLVTGMVNGVAQPVLAELRDERERQLRAFRKMLRFTAFVSMPAMFGLSLIAPELITIAITDKWLPSAHLMRILCVGGAFLPPANLYSNLLISKGKSDLFMGCTIGLGVLQLLVMLLLYPYGMLVMVKAYVVLNIGWMGVWHHFVQRQIGLTPWMALRDLLPFVGFAAVAMGAAWFLAPDAANVYAVAGVKIGVAAAAYVGLLAAVKDETLREAYAYLRKKKGGKL
jgi:O-antigen/teichoic acid export membrane protein